MQRLERPYDTLQHGLKNLTALRAAIFSGLCAERLGTCVWSFACHEKLNYTVFLRIMAENWNALLGEKRTTNLSALYKELRETVPHDEDYGYSLAGQAQNGLLCAAHCTNIILTDKPSDSLGSSDNCISSAELYLYVVQRALGDTSMIHKSGYEDELVAREIRKQLVDLEALEAVDKLSHEKLAELRKLNYQYAIPPAANIVNEKP